MADTAPSLKLTYEGAAKLLAAAVAKARDMGVPQCICIVDTGGHLLTMARLDGAFGLSVDTALRKAQTAASYGIPTGDIAAGPAPVPSPSSLVLSCGDREAAGGIPHLLHHLAAVHQGTGNSIDRPRLKGGKCAHVP